MLPVLIKQRYLLRVHDFLIPYGWVKLPRYLLTGKYNTCGCHRFGPLERLISLSILQHRAVAPFILQLQIIEYVLCLNNAIVKFNNDS
jgi:hypothetical protein